MQRYVFRMFADEWRQWTPAIAVVTVITAMIGLCVHQLAWTGDPRFRAAVTAAGVPVEEFQILSVTIYIVVALIAWVSLTIVGRASVHSTQHTYALWLLLGASPSTVFTATLIVLLVVAACGAVLGTVVSTIAGFWAIPAFNKAFASGLDLPSFTLSVWAPPVTVAVAVATTLVGGLLPARRASQTPPSAALRHLDSAASRKPAGRFLRISGGVVFLLLSIGLVVAARFSETLGTIGPGPMFNLSVDAGGCTLIAVYLLCPEIVSSVLRVIHTVLDRARLRVPALGARSAADRVSQSVTTIAPLAAGMGGIGLLLCAIKSVTSYIETVQPGTPTDLTDVWTIVAVIAVSMLATSAAVIALSARGRGHEIALLQASGMQEQQIYAMIAAETLTMSVAAILTALIPVAAGGVVCALVTHAATGKYIVVWPLEMLVSGLFVSWAVLFAIVAAPAMAPVRNGPATYLREQGV